MKLSVVVVMRDEEANIARCLQSALWADEIVVVDSHSTDNSVAVARQFTDQIFIEQWRGFGPQKNFALEKARGDWIFSLDSDEEITPELAAEIRAAIADANEMRAFFVPRRNFFCGKFLLWGGVYPDRQLRLFRRGSALFSDRPVHETLETTASPGQLNNDLLHFSNPTLSHLFRKMDQFSTLGAQHLKARGKRASLAQMLTRPAWKFFSCYLVRQGFRDGGHGFVFALLSAMQVFMRLAKLWEIQRKSTPE